MPQNNIALGLAPLVLGHARIRASIARHHIVNLQHNAEHLLARLRELDQIPAGVLDRNAVL